MPKYQDMSMNFLPYSDTIAVIATAFPLGVLAILCAFHCSLYFFYKHERYNIYFASLCGVLALNGVSGMLPLITEMNATASAIVTGVFRISTTASGLALMPAIYATLHRSIPKKFYTIIVPVLTVSFLNALFPNAWSVWISLAVVCTLLFEVGRTAYWTILFGRDGAIILGTGATLFVGTSLFFWLNILWGGNLSALEKSLYNIADMLIMPITLALWTARHFATTYRSLAEQTEEVRLLSAATLRQEQEKRAMIEAQNEELERLVAERTEEVRRQIELLEKANEEIQRQMDIQAQQSAEIQFANARLQEQNERLKELNAEKNEFLGIAAHDLKNPLGNIMMLTEMLRGADERKLDAKKIKEAIELIAMTCRRMLRLIENLLDVSKFEQGIITLQRVRVDFGKKTHFVVEAHRRAAEQKEIDIDVEIPDESPVCADALALQQVIDNIVSNAVKYSPKGKKIFVWVRGEESAKEQTRTFLLSVQDEGQGLTEEDKKKLFGKFVRLSAQPTAGEHSTGLGLYIVKRLVESMGGSVWCESVFGEGATFFVRLPAWEHEKDTE
jgi:signal transduction histidine kinase